MIYLISPLLMTFKENVSFHYYNQYSSEYFHVVIFNHLKEYFSIFRNLIYYKVEFKIVSNMHYTLIGETG